MMNMSLTSSNRDYKTDLLFFHRGLQCLVAFELKNGEFKPEYISKMDFYLEALDRQKKKDNENPSVGMILCASKDDEVVVTVPHLPTQKNRTDLLLFSFDLSIIILEPHILTA